MSDTVSSSWPVMPGSYIVGDVNAPVAVCALTTESIMRSLAGLPGVAISGMVYTANLGITRIVVNITANPAIRFLLICGRDSALFRPGQSIVALSDNGIDDQRRIVGAAGYDPVLQMLSSDQITRFRNQIEVVDWTGEENLEAIREKIGDLSARSPGRFTSETPSTQPPPEKFVTIRPGGQREPLIYDPKGYFVISIERDAGEIVLRHYMPDHTLAHEMRGRGATSMLLGLLREGLVTQLSHAGYLGEELAKAQTALQFGLRYDQDRPLKARDFSQGGAVQTTPPQTDRGQDSVAAKESQTPPSKPVAQPITLKEFESAQLGAKVDFGLTITDLPNESTFGGMFLEMDEAEPFRAYRLTTFRLLVTWDQKTRMIMGQSDEIVVGALVRVFGERDQTNRVRANQIVVLTKVARLIS